MRAVEKRLRERIASLEKENAETTAKITEFQRHYARRFRWWVELLGEGKTPSVPWLIEDDAKLMTKVGWWWWG